jgi:hypothetical protein
MRASDSGRAASGDAVSDAAAACPVFGDPEQVGTVVHPDLNEISGMAASRTQTGIVWVHNDSGDIARVFAMRTTGSHLGTFTLTGIAATDWEDISMGPGPGGVDHIYVGDIGDNQGTRSVVVVHRFAEPLIVPGPIPQDDPVTAVDSFTLAYDDGSHPDAEAMFVHPTLGDVYVLTKTDDGMSGLFRARAPLDAPGTVLERVGTVDFSDGATASSRQVTAADITVAGDRVIARTRDRALVWDTRRDIVEALTNPGCPAPIAVEVQGEAIAWTSEGDGYLTTSEVTNQPIWHVALVK